LVEVVRFFVTYGLARNKTGSVKDGITKLYQKKKKYKKCPPKFKRTGSAYIFFFLLSI
jgi:hypothetical protein